jgi:hypothetical protein
MPRLNDLNVDLELQKLPTGNYSFSATRIDSLGATEYTLATIVVDCSGSTSAFRDEMEKCLKSVVQACKYSPRSDNLMIRLVIFATSVLEVHGFKLLANCNESDYDGILQQSGIGGTTALYDACVNGIEASSIYGASLIKQDFSANGILVAITDGQNNEGVFTSQEVGKRLKLAVTAETLETMVSILVGINVGDTSVSGSLQQFVTDAGFSQYVNAGDANAKTLAKLAAFVSKSISSQSQSLGSGVSQNLTF